MKKLLALVLTLAMSCTLFAPALAYQDTDPPLWKERGYTSLEDMLERQYMTEDEYGEQAQEAADAAAWKDAYWAAHSAEFDADGWFTARYGSYYAKKDYMYYFDLYTEADFQENMREDWLSEQYWTGMIQEKVAAWAAEHPEEYAAFDADQYFKEVYNADRYYDSKQEFMEMSPITDSEEQFRAEMLYFMIQEQETAAEQQTDIDAYAAEHPEEFAEFDPMEFFEDTYSYWTMEEYMSSYGYATEEEFLRQMTWLWVQSQVGAERRQARADAWSAAHPDEYAAFDADAWLETHYPYYGDKEEYMDAYRLDTEEEFRLAMLLDMLDTQAANADMQAEVDAWAAEHPEEFAAFDADQYFKEVYNADRYYDSKQEYMELAPTTDSEEQFRTEMLYYMIQEQEAAQAAQDQWAAFQAAEPEDTAAFVADVERWFQSGEYNASHYYPRYTSLQDYMDDNYLTVKESAYAALYESWKADRAANAEAKAQRDAHKRELGGVPGELSVMLNGAYLSFPDAKPVARNDRTMIPVRALAEALGYTVSFDETTNAAVCDKGGVTVTFPLEGKKYTLTTDGKDRKYTMSSPAFAEDGRTYVPLRDLADAFGCGLAWDAGYDTAVLFDPEAIAAELNQNFTQIDRMLSTLLGKAVDTAQRNIRTTSSETIDLTLFNSLDGDRTYTVKIDATTVAGKGSMECELKLDLAGVLSQLTKEDWADVQKMLDQSEAKFSLSTLKTLLKSTTFKLYWNVDTQLLYLQSPLFSLLDESVGKDDWVSMDLDSFYPFYVTPGAALPTETVDKDGTVDSLPLLNVGAMLYDSVIARRLKWSYYDPVGVDSYAGLLEQADQVALLLGDGRFTRAGNALTYSLDTKTVNDLIRDLTAPDPDVPYSYDPLDGEDAFRACAFTVTVHDNGDYAMEMDMRPGRTLGRFVDFQITMDAKSAGGKQTLTGEVHYKNQFDFTVTASSESKEVSAPPAALPPENAKIIPWDELDF